MPKGLKTCPKCGHGCGPRSFVCANCKHPFTKMTAAPRPVSHVESSGGRGRKQCKQCEQFVGVRTRICACGYDFDSIPERVPLEETVEEKKLDVSLLPTGAYGRLSKIYAPSGSPPTLPKQNSEEDVTAWAKQTLEWGYTKGKLYTEEALAYWLNWHKFNPELMIGYPFE